MASDETIASAPAMTKVAPLTSLRGISADCINRRELAARTAICVTASAIAERRIQRRAACSSWSDGKFMRPATETRKTIPPKVRDWKLSVAPRSRTERKPKIWSRRAMYDF
jgi:hypothetical protein